jgi:sulfopyruvate decarboxylase alpha subunit
MKPDAVSATVQGLKDGGINFVASLPCTALAEVIPAIASDPAFIHVEVTTEADAIGILAGARLGGKRAALLTENSGLLVASYALRNLEIFGGIPILLVLDHRGGFGEPEGYWYFPIGSVTLPILDTLGIPYSLVDSDSAIRDAIVRGAMTVEASRRPAAILIGPGVR